MFPILFHIGNLDVYAYGFFIAIGFILGFVIALRRSRQEGVSFERMVDLFFFVVLFAIIGSRILFVLINYEYYRNHPLQILNLWEGGLVFYGGLLLSIGVSIVYLRWSRLPVWKVADLFSPSIALGLFFGRIGCFFAGCCYGKETSLPWGITFTHPNSLARLHLSLHPTQLYEALGSLFLFFFLNWKRRHQSFEGQIFWLFLLLYSALRFIIEFLRDDPRGFFLGGVLSTSQGIGIFLALISIFMLFYLKIREER